MMKYFFIGLILLDYIWKLFQVYLASKQLKKLPRHHRLLSPHRR